MEVNSSWEVSHIIEEVLAGIDEKTISDFLEKESKKETCHPDTCAGECQGMGCCDVAQGFWEALCETEL